MITIVVFLIMASLVGSFLVLALKRMRPIIKNWEISLAVILAVFNAVGAMWGPKAPTLINGIIYAPVALFTMAFYGYLWHKNGGFTEMFAFALAMSEASLAAIINLSPLGLYVISILLFVIGQAWLPIDLCFAIYTQNKSKSGYLAGIIIPVIIVLLSIPVLFVGQVLAFLKDAIIK